jgi:hypothetical protein
MIMSDEIGSVYYKALYNQFPRGAHKTYDGIVGLRS